MPTLCIVLGVCKGGELFLPGSGSRSSLTWTEARDACLQHEAALPLSPSNTDATCYLDMLRQIQSPGVTVLSVWSDSCNHESSSCGRYLLFPNTPASDFYDGGAPLGSRSISSTLVCRKGIYTVFLGLPSFIFTSHISFAHIFQLIWCGVCMVLIWCGVYMVLIWCGVCMVFI